MFDYVVCFTIYGVLLLLFELFEVHFWVLLVQNYANI